MKTKNSEIRLIVYSGVSDDESRAVVGMGAHFFPPAHISFCSNEQEMGHALKGVLSGYGILLIMIREKAELAKMCRMENRLRDHWVILLLDHSVPGLARQGLKLYPRYTGGLYEDHADILMVLEKMITKIQDKVKGDSDD